MPTKPLQRKAYGSIPHLIGSRRGGGDHGVNQGQHDILTKAVRDSLDRVIVTEKLDGSNVAVARINGEIVALQRKGYPAMSSPWFQHKLFALWVQSHTRKFDWIREGWRCCGEWLAMAHGTRYDLAGREPFVVFDVMVGETRMLWDAVKDVVDGRLALVPTLRVGQAIPIHEAMRALGKHGHYGGIDEAEGAVWRVERRDTVDFLAKYVRLNKVDGAYLPNISGNDAVWNVDPKSITGT